MATTPTVYVTQITVDALPSIGTPAIAYPSLVYASEKHAKHCLCDELMHMFHLCGGVGKRTLDVVNAMFEKPYFHHHSETFVITLRDEYQSDLFVVAGVLCRFTPYIHARCEEKTVQ